MSDDIHALTGAYALDALPEGERREYVQHLRSCARCRDEVAEFQEVCGELGVIAEEPVPASLRAGVMAAVEGVAAETVQWALGELIAARSRQDVVGVVMYVVDQLGGRVVPADVADAGALPLDIGLGSGVSLLAAAEPGSRARRDLERHLPGLVEDARQALERIRRAREDAEHRADSDGASR